MSSFIGRRDELAEIGRLLAGRRLVTLAGAGGCGKTRLAIEVAAAGTADRPDGVCWVELDTVTEPAAVAELVAAALGILVEPRAGPLRALLSRLSGQHLLLCLDTCEHVIDAVAALVAVVLRACPGVSVLATSREPLGVNGETVWRVPSLRDDEAVQLFVERAAQVRPGFTIDDGAVPAGRGGQADAIRDICRQLDGIPLAIELAAAWVRALSPAQIAAAMHDRFRLLAGGARAPVARHRTLAASVRWSYDLLDEPDRVVLRRLAVFAGGFTLAAARAVCGGDVLASIGSLVDKSLVLVSDERLVYGDRQEPRYRLLDTIREYAARRLAEAGESAAALHRHLAYFLDVAETAVSGFDRDQDRWRHILTTEYDNLRAALAWGLATGVDEPSRRLAVALVHVWFLHGRNQEALTLLGQAADCLPDDRSPMQARLLAGHAMIALGSGQPVLAADMAQRGLAIATEAADDSSTARCLALLAYGRFYHDFEAARQLALQAQRHAEAGNDRFAADLGLLIEACALTNADRHAEASVRAAILAARSQPRGERFCAAFALSCQAYAALFTGDVRRAEELAREALRTAVPLRDFATVGHAVSNLAWIRCVAGDSDGGLRLMELVARPTRSADPGVRIPLMALSPAKLHLAGGNLTAAVEWFELAASFGAPATDNWVVARALPGLAAALRRLGRVAQARQQVENAADLARRLGIPHVHAEALEQAGFLAADDDPVSAERLHHRALAIRVAHGQRTFYVDSLEAIAMLAARVGNLPRAARLLAACEVAREQIGYPRPAVDRPDHDATVTAIRSAPGDTTERAWREGSAMSLDEATAYATRARGARDRPVRGWDSLTSTEHEVVRRVVEGLTNTQIGARLFMSRSTVKTHLSNIYAKVGVGNRTELAALVATRSTAPVWPPPSFYSAT